MSDKSEKSREITARRAPTQDRAKARVDHILAVTRELLASQGLDKLTTNHIAKAAGMAVGSLYRYFPNKQAIIFEIYLRWLEEVREGLEGFKQNVPDGASLELLDGMFDVIYQDLGNDPKEAAIDFELGRAMQLYPELQEEDRLHGEEIARLLGEIWRNAGIRCDGEELLQLGRYVYELDTSLHGFVENGGDIKLGLECHKRAVRAVLEPYFDLS